MADQKISELTALTGANVADDDAIAIVDTSATETKKIVFSELKNALDTATGFVRITGDTMTGALDVQSTITSDGLTVDGFSYLSGAQIRDSSNAARGYVQGDADGLLLATDGARNITFDTNAVERMRIDSSGNVGIGTAPDTWASNYKALQLGGTFNAVSGPNLNHLGNAYWDTSGQFKYTTTGTASRYYQAGDQHIWYNAASGSADAGVSFSERMRIDASGNVGIGTSSPNHKIDVVGSSENLLELTSSGSFGTAINITQNTPSTSILVNSTSTGDIVDLQDNGTTVFIVKDGGNVGIGTSSPEGQLHLYSSSVGAPAADADDFVIEKTGDTGLSILSTTTGRIYFGDAASNDQGSIRYVHTDNSMRFETDSSEAMRIDSSGNLLLGKTSSDINTAGVELGATGYGAFCRDANKVAIFNRKTNDGTILDLKKDGSTVGIIACNSDTSNSYMIIGKGAVGLQFARDADADNIMPARPDNQSLRDDAIDLGSSSFRFDDIFATNGTIQTSDRNEKQDIAELTDAEQRVAVACKGLLRKFRWKSAVAEKGDEARTHFGIIAQDLQAAFAAEGLDAGDYAMFISSTWTDEETGEERTRMGVRYSELLAFIIAAI